MRNFLVFSFGLLASCGGGGSDNGLGSGDNADAVVTARAVDSSSSEPYTGLQCEHNGDVYICNDNTCSPDSTSEVVAATDSGAKSISIGGSVTIIAECGSNVDFNLSETENTTTTTFSSTASIPSGG